MSIKAWIHNYLGLDRLPAIEDDLNSLRSELHQLIYSEDDVHRRSVSDKIGVKAIQKMQDEDKARRHTLGEL